MLAARRPSAAEAVLMWPLSSCASGPGRKVSFYVTRNKYLLPWDGKASPLAGVATGGCRTVCRATPVVCRREAAKEQNPSLRRAGVR